jgi:hypothetical protein
LELQRYIFADTTLILHYVTRQNQVPADISFDLREALGGLIQQLILA